MSYRPWWNLEPCGTDSAYHRHIRNSEPTDPACREAHSSAEAWRQKRLRGDVVTVASAREARLRRAHAEFARLRCGGVSAVDMPLAVSHGEREYQRVSKRQRRAARQQAAQTALRLAVATARTRRQQVAA